MARRCGRRDLGPGESEPTAAAQRYTLGAALRRPWIGAAPATARAAGTAGVEAADVLSDTVTGRRRVPLADARPWPDPDLEDLSVGRHEAMVVFGCGVVEALSADGVQPAAAPEPATRSWSVGRRR
jgi:hypothetical protein